MGTVYVVPDDAVADTPLTEADLIRWQVGRLEVEGWGTVQSFDTEGLADGLYRAYHVYNGTMLSNPYYFRVLELKDDPAAAPVDIEDVLTYYSARQDVNGDHRSTREDLALLMTYIGMEEREPRVWQVYIPANVTS
ncbi:hypothetical protein N6H14_07905 [Paenibacillus sp. CC-CFT747]|nr:hypothetical protein N6H14_07905 [Paenibacillus sp. CC-CFT747]